jgi:Ni2+-binding GTPase involved in maturation of urease and hydrogenase
MVHAQKIYQRIGDSDLLMIEKQDFLKLVDTIPRFREFRDKLKSRTYELSKNCIMSNITDAASGHF